MERIINDVVPAEDDITKEQLWKRIDSTREIIEQFRAEIGAASDSLKISVESFVKSSISDNDAAIKQAKIDLARQIDALNDTIARKSAEASSAMNEQLKTNIAFLDNRFNQFSKNMEALVIGKSAERFASIMGAVDAIRTDSQKIREDVNRSLSNFQVEIGGRVGQLNAKLESVLDKFRSILKGL